MNRKICITCLFLKAISISDAVCPILGKVTAVPALVTPPKTISKIRKNITFGKD